MLECYNQILIAIGRKIAPSVNAQLKKLDAELQGNKNADDPGGNKADWCPGCGEKAILRNNLCTTCLNVNS